MSKSRRLYASTVESYRPCQGQYQLFLKYCGDKGYVNITEAWCRKHAHEFAWDWAARYVLNKPAREAYLAARAQAWEAYGAATAQAWEAYNAATAQAWAHAYINDTGESDE